MRRKKGKEECMGGVEEGARKKKGSECVRARGKKKE